MEETDEWYGDLADGAEGSLIGFLIWESQGQQATTIQRLTELWGFKLDVSRGGMAQ